MGVRVTLERVEARENKGLGYCELRKHFLWMNIVSIILREHLGLV